MPSVKHKPTPKTPQSIPAAAPPLHTLEEVRHVVQPPLSKAFINNLAVTGRMPTIRFGRRRLVTAEVFQRMLREGVE